MKTLIFGVVALLAGATLFVGKAISEEWWEGHWTNENSKSCLDDSGRFYKPGEYKGWEWTCKIVKQQKIKGRDEALVMDLRCSGEGSEYSERELLVKLNDGRMVSNGEVLRRCSLAEVEKDQAAATKPVVSTSDRLKLTFPVADLTACLIGKAAVTMHNQEEKDPLAAQQAAHNLCPMPTNIDGGELDDIGDFVNAAVTSIAEGVYGK